MFPRFSQNLLLGLFTCAVCCTSSAHALHKNLPAYTIDHRALSLDGTEKIRGHRIVVVTNLNILRYQYKLGSTTTYQNPPSPDGVLTTTPADPATLTSESHNVAEKAIKPSEKSASALLATTPGGCTSSPENMVACLNQAVLDEKDQVNLLIAQANQASQNVVDGATSLRTLLAQSDALLSTSPAAYKAAIATEAATLQTATNPSWPITQTLLTQRAVRQAEIVAQAARVRESVNQGQDTPARKALLDQIDSVGPDISSIAASLQAVTRGETEYNQWVANRATLQGWGDRLTSLSAAFAVTADNAPDPLALSYPVPCDFSFASTQDTQVSLNTVSDALADFSTGDNSGQSTPPTAKLPITEKLVTVECTTPVTLAVGVAFSSLAEHEYAVQQTGSTTSGSTTTPVNSFVYTSNSSFHPEAVGAIHVRLYEFTNQPTLSLQGTFAVAANIKGQNSGGSSADYLIGATLGFARYAYLTAGAYIGQVSTLGGGFKVNDPVPAGVTTPPLQQGYRTGFGIALTFSK